MDEDTFRVSEVIIREAMMVEEMVMLGGERFCQVHRFSTMIIKPVLRLPR